jgi:hypothetical protein
MIKLSNAFEPRVDSDFRDCEVCFVHKGSRKVHAPRARDSYRRRPQMLEAQAPQVASAETDTIGKCLNIGDIERPFGDQFKRARDYR